MAAHEITDEQIEYVARAMAEALGVEETTPDFWQTYALAAKLHIASDRAMKRYRPGKSATADKDADA